jgi:uncharacterized membrane protein YeiB
MNSRIIGIDVARALAVIGMVIVNFKVVLGEEGQNWVKLLARVFDGKASATFVVLAGVGIALSTNSALRNNDLLTLKIARTKIAKRALFLFVVGLSYMVIWPADILHFYGVYMLFTLLLIRSKPRRILMWAAAVILAYPFLLYWFDYETGWNLDTLAYLDFWEFGGFLRNLFINGFHPVLPWVSFMLVGFWYGKQDLNNDQFLKKVIVVSSSVFIGIKFLSYFSIRILSNGNEKTLSDLSEIIGTNPMPPLPIYMLNGVAIAVLVISLCILLGKNYATNKVVVALNNTGQLALTFYVAHVVLGMGIIEAISPSKMGTYSIEFSVGYALIFSLLCIVFANLWLKFKHHGPLEWIMKMIIK